MPHRLHVRALARAADIIGGVDLLAEELAMPHETLVRYLRGEAAVPTDVFLRATEIITEAGLADASKALKPEVERAK